MNRIKRLIATVKKIFPRHRWTYTSNFGTNQRECSTCRCVEQHEYDDWGNYWLQVHPGDRSKH